MHGSGAGVSVFASPPALAIAAARCFVATADAAIEARGEFVVALAGGSTPRETYTQLATAPNASAVDWTRVRVLWGDERCVPPDDAASNYGMARDALLQHVPVRPEDVHRIHGEDDPPTAAREYERVLRGLLKAPESGTRDRRIDLVLLGLGADGHTASLFPGAADTHDSASWVAAARAPEAPFARVTLTPAVLNASVELVFIVQGAAKAGIVRRVLEGPRVPHALPAQLIAPRDGRVRWFLDSAAAGELAKANALEREVGP